MHIDQDWLAENSTYIDGGWVPGAGAGLVSVNPATGGELARYRGSDHQQVDVAVAAARRSFDQGGWRRTRPAARAAALRRLADLIDSHAEELAQLVVAEVGSPVTLARTLQVGQPTANFRLPGAGRGHIGQRPRRPRYRHQDRSRSPGRRPHPGRPARLRAAGQQEGRRDHQRLAAGAHLAGHDPHEQPGARARRSHQRPGDHAAAPPR